MTASTFDKETDVDNRQTSPKTYRNAWTVTRYMALSKMLKVETAVECGERDEELIKRIERGLVYLEKRMVR